MVVRIMGFKESRLGKIVDVFSGLGKSVSTWLKSVDIDDTDIEKAISVVNEEAEEGRGVSEKYQKLKAGTIEYNALEAETITDRDETVGPVFSGASKDDDKAQAELDEIRKRNEVLEDETMRYVNGNPVELQKVEPQKLAKGGKERERVK